MNVTITNERTARKYEYREICITGIPEGWKMNTIWGHNGPVADVRFDAEGLKLILKKPIKGDKKQ